MIRHFYFLIAMVLLTTVARAQSLDVKEFTLKNGLTVVMVEDHTVPSVCFSIAFRTGSRNERPGVTGISHLFEHMMFNGSKKYKPTEFDNILEAGGGYSNAGTGKDMTFYYEEFNPELLDKVLDMEADRLHSLKIDTANIEQERGIVKEERRVSTDNNVQSKMFEDLYSAAFLIHPYRNPIVGWMKDLDNITLQDAKEYFKTYYAPNNATVIVVGDFDSKSLRPSMERLFGPIPRQPMPRPINNAEPPQNGERRLKLHKAAELPAVALGYKTVGVLSPDFCPLDLLAAILSQGQSSRLYKRLVRELQIATDIGCSMEECVDPSLFTFYVQMQPGKSVGEAESEIFNVINDIVHSGVTDEELQKAKNTVHMSYANEFKTNAGIASRLGRFEVIYGGYKKSSEIINRYAQVSAEDIKKVAEQYLSERARSAVVLVPEKPVSDSAEPSVH